jgi:hypothetical protein
MYNHPLPHAFDKADAAHDRRNAIENTTHQELVFNFMSQWIATVGNGIPGDVCAKFKLKPRSSTMYRGPPHPDIFSLVNEVLMYFGYASWTHIVLKKNLANVSKKAAIADLETQLSNHQ